MSFSTCSPTRLMTRRPAVRLSFSCPSSLRCAGAEPTPCRSSGTTSLIRRIRMFSSEVVDVQQYFGRRWRRADRSAAPRSRDHLTGPGVVSVVAEHRRRATLGAGEQLHVLSALAAAVRANQDYAQAMARENEQLRRAVEAATSSPGQGHAHGTFRCRCGGGIRPVDEVVAKIEHQTGARCPEARRTRPSEHLTARQTVVV